MPTSRLIIGSFIIAAVLVALAFFVGKFIPLKPTFITYTPGLPVATSSVAAMADPVTILIVPGHDDTDGGAVFGNVAESDLTRMVGKELYDLLIADERFAPTSTRKFSPDNEYSDFFSHYFIAERSNILEFLRVHKEASLAKLRSGEFKERVTVVHNQATSRAVVILYGINKWANDNEIDLVLHIHFNNDVRNNMYTAGRQSGFAIYTPEAQMPNYTKTIELTKTLYESLKRFTNPSTLSIEQSGLIESQDLIAIGAYGTRTGPSVLIEYGYIYEPKYQSARTQDEAVKELAYATYLGLIEHYFAPKATTTATSSVTEVQ